MLAKQNNCSLHLILRTLCGPSRDKESHFFCRSATRTFLGICRVIIYRNVAMLLKPSLSWLARAGTRGMSVTCQVTSLVGKHILKFQVAVEICFLLGKTIMLLLSDCVSVISFAGFGLFLSESSVIFNSKTTYLYFVVFHIWISGGAIPIPRPKNCSNVPS